MNKYIFFLILLTFIMFRTNSQEILKEKQDSFWEDDILVLKGKYKINQFYVNGGNFSWFMQNYNEYKPTNELVNYMKNLTECKWLIFAGTWCGDTKNNLPVFMKIFDEAKLNPTTIQLFFLNRDKKTFYNYHKKFKINFLPTIIIYKQNKEIARLVENGTEEDFEKSLNNLLKKLANSAQNEQ